MVLDCVGPNQPENVITATGPLLRRPFKALIDRSL
jgi:hypothetical protein